MISLKGRDFESHVSVQGLQDVVSEVVRKLETLPVGTIIEIENGYDTHDVFVTLEFLTMIQKVRERLPHLGFIGHITR